uniref:Uncharacterized protein n=1 Tax=Anguilla anguilla TaxID=7936 RepID=A0A0E9SUJ2_ANGAN
MTLVSNTLKIQYFLCLSLCENVLLSQFSDSWVLRLVKTRHVFTIPSLLRGTDTEWSVALRLPMLQKTEN